MRKLFLFYSAVLLFVSSSKAIDHSNLDEGRPLRVEDSYPIASGEFAVEFGMGYVVQRRGSDDAFFPVEVLYGIFPNAHVAIGTTLSTDPDGVDESDRSGDLHFEALYNFNQETLWAPAFGLKASANFPTGLRSRGVDVELKGLITKSISRLSFYFNPAYEFIGGSDAGERSGIYSFTLGASYPVGAPMYTRTTLIGDVFTEQSNRRGESNVYGAEIGFRHQVTQRAVIDFGVGSEFAGPAERSIFFVTAGMSYAF